jgi:DNA polymerase-3 subunit gamma/tau
VLAKEGHTAEDGAIALIARAAEGSVRDGLSLLDQALALGQGHLTAAAVAEMLGLSGRAAIFDLLECMFLGDAKAALSSLNALHDKGGDPLMILTDAADAVHALSRLKAVPGLYPADFSSEDRARADKLSSDLAVPRLSIAWQMLLKGLEEAARAPRPFAAVEMLMIRMCYTAHLPSPADIIGELRGVPTSRVDRKADTHQKIMAPTPQTVSAEARADRGEADGGEAQSATRSFASFEDIVAHAAQIRDIKLKTTLEEQVELVKFGPGYLELHTLDGAPKNLAPDLARKLQAWSGERWIVSLSEEKGLPPLGVRKREEEARALEEIRKHPAVKNLMHHFPDAEIKSVRSLD